MKRLSCKIIRMSHALVLLCGMAALMLLLAGCSSKEDTGGETISTSRSERAEETALEDHQENEAGDQSAPPEEAEIDPETMDLIKYNLYISLNNEMVELCDSIYNYYLVVEDQAEFALIPDTGLPYGYNAHISSLSALEDAFAVSGMEPSYGRMDELVAELYDSTYALIETFTTVCNSGYGAGPSYSDNQYENAKKWHAVIHENVPVFQSLCYEFFDEVSALAVQRSEAERMAMLEEGRLIIYHAATCIELGRQILQETYDQGVYDENLTELDTTEIKVLYQELTATIQAFDEAAADNQQMIQESLSNSRPFDGLFDRLADSISWMIETVERGQGVGSPGSLGSILFIEECLSDCIDRYNSVFVD